MKFLKGIIIIASFLLHATALADSALPRDACRAIVKELETVSNLNQHDIEAKAPGALDQLRNGEISTYYFIAYNIYVENLFNQGKVDKARKVLDAMMTEASNKDDAECQVISLRTQGQFYYKLGLYEQAADSFRKAMEICPQYDSGKLESYFTWSSTLFWLIQSDIQIGKLDEAEQWLNKMDGMLKWLEVIGDIDSIGYKPVMALSLKAKLDIQKGELDAAREMLDKCAGYIRPGIPSRAYVEYYAGRMLLALREKRYAEALPLLDELIEIHINDYKPIAAEFIGQKANLLYESGRYEESANAFEQYEGIKEQVNKIAIAQQLNELKTRYDVEKLQHEHAIMRNNLYITIIICIALSFIIALIMVNQRKLKRKNVILAKTISELHQLSKENTDEIGVRNETASSPNPELLAIGDKIVDYIKSTQCYLSSDCGRETIKGNLGVSESLLSKALPLATGMTFVNYINYLRLNHAIYLLDNHLEMTITDISSACGFGSLRQFQRLFKQQYDLSPSAYREARNISDRQSTGM